MHHFPCVPIAGRGMIYGLRWGLPSGSAAFSQGGSMKIRILGVPLDLGQERRGVDMGPAAVRVAGLNAALKNLGHQVEDAGNVHVKLPEEQHFGDKRAKYLKEIEETCQEVAHRIYQTLEAGFFPVSLGGDHSIAIGT